jgi:site-specific DNA-methyltransferase (adenine-specific)
VLKQDRVAIMFYGWTKIDAFFEAWRGAGFQPVGHIVFRKSYSSKSRLLRYQHEQAFLLAKGRPPLPRRRDGDALQRQQAPSHPEAPNRAGTLDPELLLA